MSHAPGNLHAASNDAWDKIAEDRRKPFQVFINHLKQPDVFEAWLAATFGSLGRYFFLNGLNAALAIQNDSENGDIIHFSPAGSRDVERALITIVRGPDKQFRIPSTVAPFLLPPESSPHDLVLGSFFWWMAHIARKGTNSTMTATQFANTFDLHIRTDDACRDVKAKIEDIFDDWLPRAVQNGLNAQRLVIYANYDTIHCPSCNDGIDIEQQATRFTDANVPLAYLRTSLPPDWEKSTHSRHGLFAVFGEASDFPHIIARLRSEEQAALILNSIDCHIPCEKIPGQHLHFEGTAPELFELMTRIGIGS